MVMTVPKVLSHKDAEIGYRPRMVRGASIFMSESVLDMMIEHADAGYLENKEVMGLMMGTIYKDDIGRYVVVTDAVTSGLDSDETNVRFDRESIEDLFRNMDFSEGRMVVGWYHSHPGFGCYLSDTDIRTHLGIFGEDIGFALVIDPSDGTVKVFICDEGQQKDAKMVIME